MESIVMVVLKATEAWDTHQKERAKQLGMALQTAETGHSEQPRENEWAWAGTVRGQEDLSTEMGPVKPGPAPSSEAEWKGTNPRPPRHLTSLKTNKWQQKRERQEGVSNAKHVVGLLALQHWENPRERGGETMSGGLAGRRGPGSWGSERQTGETARALDREQTPLPAAFTLGWNNWRKCKHPH